MKTYQYQFPKPDSTASVIALREMWVQTENAHTDRQLAGVKVCLIRRGKDPFAGKLSLPGGFIEPVVKADDIYRAPGTPPQDDVLQTGETLELCAGRELYEECSLFATASQMVLVAVHSDPKRDPRGHVIDHVYACLFESAKTFEEPARAGDDAASLEFTDFHYNTKCKRELFAFDHAEALDTFFKRFYPQLKVSFV